MKVVLISEAIYPRTGPVSRVTGFAKALADQGHSVMLLAPGSGWPSSNGSVRYRQFGHIGQLTKYWGMMSELNRVLNETDPDIVQLTSYYAAILPELGRLHGVKVVQDYHASLSMMERSAPVHLLNSFAESRICRTGNSLVVPTRLLSEYVMHRYSRRSHVIPNAIDLKRFKPSKNRGEVLDRTGLPKESRIVFFHGSVYPENVKALALLREIIKRINSRVAATTCVVAGEVAGTPRNEDGIAYLGYVENLAALIACADIAVVPVSITEMGIRSRVVEYLACGVPVVTTPSGAAGLEEAERKGFLKSCVGLQSIVEESVALLQLHRERADELRRACREYAEVTFSEPAIAQELLAVYKEVLDEENGPRDRR